MQVAGAYKITMGGIEMYDASHAAYSYYNRGDYGCSGEQIGKLLLAMKNVIKGIAQESIVDLANKKEV